MLKRIATLVAASLVVMLLLSGCSKNSGEKPTTPPASDQASPDPAGGDPGVPAPKPDVTPPPKAEELPPIAECSPVAFDAALPEKKTSQAGGTRYSIDQKGSCIAYTVREQFFGHPLPVSAVGKSSVFVGDIIFGDDGTLQPSTIVMDVRTLKSDQASRDEKVAALLSAFDKYPVMELAITGTDGRAPVLVEGQEATFKLTGKLTIKEVEKPLVFDTKAKLNGDVLTLVATTKLKQTDFGLPLLNIRQFVTVEDTVQLYVKVTAKRK